MGLAGGDVAEADAAGALIEVDAAEEVAGLVLEAGGVRHRAGGHHPDDVPLHETLGLGRVLRLLADGYLVAPGDEAGNVGVAGVVGDAAHGDLLLHGLGVLAVVPAGEGQVQLTGGDPGVVREHLIEVPQTEEEDGVRVVFLDLQILPHHGRQLRHGITSCFKNSMGCVIAGETRHMPLSSCSGAEFPPPRRRAPRCCCL